MGGKGRAEGAGAGEGDWDGLGWAAGLGWARPGWAGSWVCGFVGRSRVRVGELPKLVVVAMNLPDFFPESDMRRVLV